VFQQTSINDWYEAGRAMTAVGRLKPVDLDLAMSGEGTAAAVELDEPYAGTRP
jgi:hypothetical protein